MSIVIDSTDYIERTANVPPRTGGTIAGLFYLNSLPGTDVAIFMLSQSASIDIAGLRWNGSALRLHNYLNGASAATNPTASAWYYIYMRFSASVFQAGWKTIAESSFNASKQWASDPPATGTANTLRVGGNFAYGTSIDANVYRLSVWDEVVTDANLLLAAATDLGYTTNINTHIPGTTTGDPSRYADSSGNARNWTPSGTISDGSDPFGGGRGAELMGQACL
jgi:hypothetical protein